VTAPDREDRATATYRRWRGTTPSLTGPDELAVEVAGIQSSSTPPTSNTIAPNVRSEFLFVRTEQLLAPSLALCTNGTASAAEFPCLLGGLDPIQWIVMSVFPRLWLFISQIRMASKHSKSASACKIDRPVRMVMLAMRQSMNFLTVSPLRRQIRYMHRRAHSAS